MRIIAAVADNLAIGKDNKLLYHIPNDLKHFKEITNGRVVVMGRKTFESLPNGPLPDRTNIVLTRKMTNNVRGVIVFDNPMDVLELNNSRIDIIGGATLYRLFLPFVDELIITHVHDVPADADTFFPEFKQWFKVVESNHIPKSDKNGFDLDIVRYQINRHTVYQPVIELFRDFLVKNNIKEEFEEGFEKQNKKKLIYNNDYLNKFYRGTEIPDMNDSLFMLTYLQLHHSNTVVWETLPHGHSFWCDKFDEFRSFAVKQLLLKNYS